MLRPTRSPQVDSTIVANVELVATIVPSSRIASSPHGARSQTSVADDGVAVDSVRSGVAMEVVLHEANRLFRVAHMRAMPGRFHPAQRAWRQVPMHELTDLGRRAQRVGGVHDH